MGKGLFLLFTSIILVLGCARSPHRSLGKIRLAYVASPGLSLVLVALGKGYFKDEGLDIQGTAYSFGKPAVASLLRGEADLATSAEAPVINAILGGGKLDILCVIGTSSKDLSVVADRSAGIQGIADLAGKRIGVAKGSSAEFYLDSLLLLHRIDPASIETVDILPEEVAAGLLAGTISAAVTWSPFVLRTKEALGERGLVLNDDNAYVLMQVVTSDSAFARSRPEALEAFVRALVRAEREVAAAPEKCIALISEVAKLEAGELRETFGLYRFKVGLDQALLFTLEEEARWIQEGQPDGLTVLPNFLDSVYDSALVAIDPKRVSFIR